MQAQDGAMPAATSVLTLLAAADLQDHLMVASNDLERLQRLLDDASTALGSAITALQFQDLATQLIAHTNQRLRSCVDRLGRDVFAGDEDDDDPGLVEQAPLRPNPVTQDEMDAGSVELF